LLRNSCKWAIFVWKIEIFFKLPEKSKFFGNLPRKSDFFVKLPEKNQKKIRNLPVKMDFFSRIHDPQISNQIDAAALDGPLTNFGWRKLANLRSPFHNISW